MMMVIIMSYKFDLSKVFNSKVTLQDKDIQYLRKEYGDNDLKRAYDLNLKCIIRLEMLNG